MPLNYKSVIATAAEPEPACDRNRHEASEKYEMRLTVEKRWGLELRRLTAIHATVTHLSAAYFAYLICNGRIPWGLLLFRKLKKLSH